LCLPSRRSTAPVPRACAELLFSRALVVALRKSIPQDHNLQTAVELGLRLHSTIMNMRALLLHVSSPWKNEKTERYTVGEVSGTRFFDKPRFPLGFVMIIDNEERQKVAKNWPSAHR